MKELPIVLAVVFVVLLLLEVGLRSRFGFGNPLIYVADAEIGYLLAPNQRTRRFGNRIEINEYSMRGEQISPTRKESTLRVLLLGDSIANGGWWTDRAEILSAMMVSQLKATIAKDEFTEVEVLNASANSWGPRNELAYLKRFGTFGAQVVVLLINTDDLFATAPSSVQVGRDRNYPAKKPMLALQEVFTRYVLPAPNIPELATLNQEPGDRVGFNLAAIGEIQAIAKSNNIKFLLAMTPLLREVGLPGPRDYEIKERQRLTEFTTSKQIVYLDFLPVFNSAESKESLYRDHIHLSYQGNWQVSQAITQSIGQLLELKSSAITDREEKLG
ncbi:SGNH/GDSL hydrolase family protein [Phormidium sp. LEGE 05292]|uniref:SGNH/GDSL hydrolase family protein n=1 Tax=[Phormidium] sp. LEGE 05292 TaxID=767427 RepID=UPI00187FE654|nr:SGNH/GDSL hydrolase family protein [Phormidium sp. LEGE 05292]MBE9224672.1 SGNH/GDSL hydrolase family protein [Phormidium sp. LEGE 05292]